MCVSVYMCMTVLPLYLQSFVEGCQSTEDKAWVAARAAGAEAGAAMLMRAAMVVGSVRLLSRMNGYTVEAASFRSLISSGSERWLLCL